jgi:hypothetical protein
MCARVLVCNTNFPAHRTFANVFIDTFSFTSFITDNVANKLKLRRRSADLQVNFFAERESKMMSTSAINFSVKTDFGDTIAVDGYDLKMI